jgi:hypothetical protein
VHSTSFPVKTLGTGRLASSRAQVNLVPENEAFITDSGVIASTQSVVAPTRPAPVLIPMYRGDQGTQGVRGARGARGARGSPHKNRLSGRPSDGTTQVCPGSSQTRCRYRGTDYQWTTGEVISPLQSCLFVGCPSTFRGRKTQPTI